MSNRLGTNHPVYDASRLMAFFTGAPTENVLTAPIILDNPAITSGIALFSHTPQPFSAAVTAASELTLIDLSIANTAGAGTQFYGIKIQSDSDTVDTGAGIALFNLGRADSIYIDVAGKAGSPAANNPTGIGIDVNKSPTSTAERAAVNSSQQGIQIFDWSQTDQGIGGPRGLIIQKISELSTDHLLMTLRSNRNLAQFIVVSGDAKYDGTKPAIRFDDETSGNSWWVIRASGEQVFNKDGIGIQWITPGAKTAYILSSTNDLKLKSGGTGIRFVNQADTQTIVMMQDDLSVDIPNNETRFQALKIVSDRIENTVTNALAAVSMNYNGYNGGTTQFRDFKVFDGKQNVVAIFTGTYKNVLIGTATDKATTQPHIFLNDGSTWMQQSGTSTGYSMLMWNLWSDNGTFKRRIATNPTTAIYAGPGSGAGAVEIYFNTDAGNTVDSTATLSRYYHFGPTTIGFLGSGPVAKPSSTTDLRQALIDLGLYTTGGATPLNLNGGLLTAGGINVGSGTGAGSGEVVSSGSLKPPSSAGSAVFAIDTSGGSTITISNNSTGQPIGASSAFSGIFFVNETSADGHGALFLQAANSLVLISQTSGGVFTTTQGTASSINVYLSSNIITIENKRGANRTFNIMMLRTRAAS